MMTTGKNLAVVLALAASSVSMALAEHQVQGTQPVVVELYTSQGCAACPPADMAFGDLAQIPDVIALAMHVDYWDYLGWADRFAKADFTQRQKSYAQSVGDRIIYTPQIIVNGLERLQGTKSTEIAAAIDAHRQTATPVTLSVGQSALGHLLIEAQANPPLTAPVSVNLVRYLPLAEVSIEHGENAGREMRYHNIVTEFETLATWDGVSAFRHDIALRGEAPMVVLVQEDGPGRILAAARLGDAAR